MSPPPLGPPPPPVCPEEGNPIVPYVLLWIHSRHTLGHPVTESTKGPPDPGFRHPGLQVKQEVLLNNCIVENSIGPGVCPLLSQNHG